MLRQQSVKDCESLGLSLDDLIKVTVDTTRLKEVRALADTESKAQSVLLDPEREDGPSKRIAGCEKEIADIKATLAGPSQKYQQYVTELQQWTKRRAAIEGSEEVENTLKYFEKQLTNCNTAIQLIPALLEEVITKASQVYEDIVALAAVYSELYAPVQKFIEKHPLAKTQFKMSFETKIIERRFADEFLSKIRAESQGLV